MGMEIEMFTGLPDGAVFVRKTVFQEEQGFENEFDDIDSKAVHFIMTDLGKPVGTCRVYTEDESGVHILGRLAVLREYRDRHVGSALLRAAEEYVLSVGGRELRLHSQCAARKFYEVNGFAAVGNVDDDEGCPHIWMSKAVN